MSLTQEQRSHLEQRLLEERARAQRMLNRSVEEYSGESEQDRAGDLTSLPFHVADRGTDTMQTELDASMATESAADRTEDRWASCIW